MSSISVGVIGTGGMGTRHAQNLHALVPGARVSATYDVDTVRAQQVAEDCGAVAFGDPYALIADPSVDAVLIASIASTHAPFVKACLEAGKPVLCEKPLAVTAAEALELVRAEEHLCRQLISVGLMRRFDPQHLAVKRALDAGRVGKGRMFKGVHRNPMIPPHLPGDVLVNDSAVHDIDSTRWLLGEEVTEAFARGVRTRPEFSEETVDMMLVQLKLTGECLSTIEVTVAVEYGYEVSAEVVGERGTVLSAQTAGATVRAGGVAATDIEQIWLDRFRDAYIDELVEWIASVQKGTAFPGANAWDGYMALVVTDACTEALRSGQPVPVPTPQKPALYGGALEVAHV